MFAMLSIIIIKNTLARLVTLVTNVNEFKRFNSYSLCFRIDSVRTAMYNTVDFTSLGTRVDFAWERTPSVLYPIATQVHGNGSCRGEVSIPWVSM